MQKSVRRTVCTARRHLISNEDTTRRINGAIAGEGGFCLGSPMPDASDAPRATDRFLQAAIDEATKGLAAGGIPIGSVLVCDGEIIGRGHNQRVQSGSVIHHGEMNCLENAGRQKAATYRRCILYTTLSPCPMCSGAILLYKIPRVIVGENVTFMGDEDHLRSQNVRVEVLQNEECIAMMREFIAKNPTLWNEDIGV
jgi:cytosine deaminase